MAKRARKRGVIAALVLAVSAGCDPGWGISRSQIIATPIESNCVAETIKAIPTLEFERIVRNHDDFEAEFSSKVHAGLGEVRLLRKNSELRMIISWGAMRKSPPKVEYAPLNDELINIERQIVHNCGLLPSNVEQQCFATHPFWRNSDFCP